MGRDGREVGRFDVTLVKLYRHMWARQGAGGIDGCSRRAVVQSVWRRLMAKVLTQDGDGRGRDDGSTRGPRDGDGATIHHQSGETDFDGTPGDELPQKKAPEDDLPYPPTRAGD